MQNFTFTPTVFSAVIAEPGTLDTGLFTCNCRTHISFWVPNCLVVFSGHQETLGKPYCVLFKFPLWAPLGWHSSRALWFVNAIFSDFSCLIQNSPLKGIGSSLKHSIVDWYFSNLRLIPSSTWTMHEGQCLNPCFNKTEKAIAFFDEGAVCNMREQGWCSSCPTAISVMPPWMKLQPGPVYPSLTLVTLAEAFLVKGYKVWFGEVPHYLLVLRMGLMFRK